MPDHICIENIMTVATHPSNNRLMQQSQNATMMDFAANANKSSQATPHQHYNSKQEKTCQDKPSRKNIPSNLPAANQKCVSKYKNAASCKGPESQTIHPSASTCDNVPAPLFPPTHIVPILRDALRPQCCARMDRRQSHTRKEPSCHAKRHWRNTSKAPRHHARRSPKSIPQQPAESSGKTWTKKHYQHLTPQD